MFNRFFNKQLLHLPQNMRYTLVNRKKSIDAKNDTEFLTWMRKHDLQYFSTNEEFMAAYALRKATFEKIILRSDSVENFVEDLQKNNLLKIEDTPAGIFGLFAKKS